MAYCTDIRHVNEKIINGNANKVKMYAGMYKYSMYCAPTESRRRHSTGIRICYFSNLPDQGRSGIITGSGSGQISDIRSILLHNKVIYV